MSYVDDDGRRMRQEVQKGLDILVDFHMLGQPEALTRYRMHDLLRRYARELAASSDENSVAEIHDELMTHLELQTPNQYGLKGNNSN